jgi:hypothetical protein
MRAARCSKYRIVATAFLVAIASPGWANEPVPPSPQQAAAQSPAPAEPPVTASVPIRFFANVHLRYDFTRLEDRADLLLDGNQVDGLLARLRFGLMFNDARSTLSGGLRFSAGEAPNPASPFIRLGDAFRPVTFNLDQFYVDVRPFANKNRVHGVFGKMPLPFWRGDKGVIRSEMTWDDDISPVGAVAQVKLYEKGVGAQQIALENTVGYFIVEWFRRDRFAGLVGDVSLSADQLKLTVKRATLAAAYYHWQNLNSGARAPSFVPGQSASLLPGQSAFLLRPGFQATNAQVDLGSGVRIFRENEFDIFEATGQGTAPVTVPWLGRSEAIVLAYYAHNFSVENETDGVGVSVGLVGGDAMRRLKPYSLHGTWRRVEADAALATFADSDIGAGTDVEGFEISGDYRVHRNLSLTLSHFNFDGAPNRSTKVKRTFLGMVLDF